MHLRAAAIAKNEAPYIAQWVYHHLYFGFSSVEVVVNNSCDLTSEILSRIARHHPLDYRDIGSGWLGPKGMSFQKAAYFELLAKAKRQGVGRMLFVDIDEYWTPADFTTSVGDFLEALSWPQIMSCEWALLRSDYGLFDLGYERTNQLCKNNHVKSIFNPELEITRLSVHNVECIGVKNVLSDGSPHPRPYKDRLMDARVHESPLRPAFIFHRYWRSPIEYVVSLGQGLAQDRVGQNGHYSTLKLNRNGFSGGGVPTAYDISEAYLKAYHDGYREFLTACGVTELVHTAQEGLLSKFDQVVAQLRQHEQSAPETVDRLLSGLNSDALLKQGRVEPQNAQARKAMQATPRLNSSNLK